MKNLYPSVVELALIGILAAVAGTVVAFFGVSQSSLLGAAFPLLLASMLLGARRGGHLSSKQPADSDTETALVSAERD